MGNVVQGGVGQWSLDAVVRARDAVPLDLDLERGRWAFIVDEGVALDIDPITATPSNFRSRQPKEAMTLNG